MKLKLCFFLLVLGLASAVCSDWQTPINMGSVINSSQEDYSPFIIREGTSLYYARGPVENRDIYVSKFRNGQWQIPLSLGENINSSYDERDPTVIGDTMIIFASDRPSPYSGWPYHLWFSKQTTVGTWGPAQLVGDPIGSDYGDETPWMMWEGRDSLLLFFASLDRPGGQGWWDIWQARKVSGVWQTPTNLGSPVNTSGLESSPNIWYFSTKGLDSIRMYYVSTFGGYYADRIRGIWRNPVRLTDVINGGGMDRPSITFDNRTLYFTSDRPGGYGLRDIWYSTYTTGVESEGNRPISSPEIGLTATPNPFETRSLIAFSLSQEEGINLDIYGLDGRRIRFLVHSTFFPGTHRVIWDGCDDRGSSIGPGLYFLRLRTTKVSLTARLLKL